jgi:hypothetical protein
MATFTSPDDFFGTYDGRWDGRRARLTIDDRVGDSGRWLCNITLEDLDRDAKYRASHVTHSDKKHIFRDLELAGLRGTRGTKRIKLLTLHTWDVDFLSGHDVWNGTEFGFAFERAR